MTLRAPDIKDEHGWQILDEEDRVVGHQPSRDKARYAARVGLTVGRIASIPVESNGQLDVVGDIEINSRGEIVRAAPKTPEEMAADTAHAVHLEILSQIKVIKETWVDLAANLFRFRKGNMFEALGYQSFNAYLSDPDVEIEPRWAYDYLAMYEQLVINRGVEPEELKELEVSKVKESLPAIRRGQVTWEEARADIKTLSKRDIVLKMSGRASPTPGKPDTGTSISTETEPQYMVCATCGTRKQINPETGEFIR